MCLRHFYISLIDDRRLCSNVEAVAMVGSDASPGLIRNYLNKEYHQSLKMFWIQIVSWCERSYTRVSLFDSSGDFGITTSSKLDGKCLYTYIGAMM
jgi:hypothetical protein